MMIDDVRAYNALAWDRQVERGNPWTIPADPALIASARRGDCRIVLTPTRPVPLAWFPPLKGARVLCLASGGGQQGPVLAAAGAEVTVLDNSPRQLERDREVARREGLEIALVEGDMSNLECFPDRTFDLIVHPVSNCFVPDVRPVWREAYRVLHEGGVMLAGFCNGFLYLFDDEDLERGDLHIRYSLPYADPVALDPVRLAAHMAEKKPLEFGHSLEDQIGGQLDAGFLLLGFYEDRDPKSALSRHLALFAATRAMRGSCKDQSQ
ncbi:MAG: class I SAM-dependent methyltransferase [Candidatus Eisenbacteria bacterium]|nr:class I SAM-dependent methyltransferase [Candidatus Eisenbacteria bacterium]